MTIAIAGKQLFLDDTLIASSCQIERTYHRPEMTGEILLAIDQPYEAGAQLGLYCSVMREGGVTRLWYEVHSDRLRHISYAESDDGLNFRKPLLNLHQLGGSTANNVVMPDPVAGSAPWIDPHADTDHRYRAYVKAYPGWPDEQGPSEFRHYASSDGLYWTREEVDPIGDCDTQHIAFWDQRCGRYVMYTRKWFRFDDRHDNYRTVRRLESDDLVHWQDGGVVLQAATEELAARPTHTGQPALDYYGAAVFRYPDASGFYLGLAAAYWHWLPRLEKDRWGPSGDPQHAVIERLRPAAMDVHLVISSDGRDFRRIGDGAPFMGLEAEGSFASRMVWAMPNPIPMGEELWIYYIGSNKDHDGFVDSAAGGELSGLSRAVLRVDGFASLDADREGGEFSTPLMRFAGERLELNVDTGGGGCVKVEVQDEAGVPIAGFAMDDSIPVCVNSTQAVARWKKSAIGALRGRPVKLRFALLDARLYAFSI